MSKKSGLIKFIKVIAVFFLSQARIDSKVVKSLTFQLWILFWTLGKCNLYIILKYKKAI